MAGALRWPPTDWMLMTLREFVLTYDGLVRHDWDQTALLASLTHNVMYTASAMFAKPKFQPAGPSHYHPHHLAEPKQQSRGMKITRDNIDVLRQIAGAFNAKP